MAYQLDWKHLSWSLLVLRHAQHQYHSRWIAIQTLFERLDLREPRMISSPSLLVRFQTLEFDRVCSKVRLLERIWMIMFWLIHILAIIYIYFNMIEIKKNAHLTSYVESHWITSSISLNIVCHTRVNSGHFLVHMLQHKRLITYKHTSRRIRK